jgi:hypothetical protein
LAASVADRESRASRSPTGEAESSAAGTPRPARLSPLWSYPAAVRFTLLDEQVELGRWRGILLLGLIARLKPSAIRVLGNAGLDAEVETVLLVPLLPRSA